MDERRRDLERRAKQGDPEAIAALQRTQQRQQWNDCSRGLKPHNLRDATEAETAECKEQWPLADRFLICNDCGGARRVITTYKHGIPAHEVNQAAYNWFTKKLRDQQVNRRENDGPPQ